jgi:hypothetical protein
MESEWMRLKHRGTSCPSQNLQREWFSCEVPDEDENSGDDDWSHVADVFLDIHSGSVSRIQVVMRSDIDDIFDSEVTSGNFQRVVLHYLLSLSDASFNEMVPFYCTRFNNEEDFVYFRNAHQLV